MHPNLFHLFSFHVLLSSRMSPSQVVNVRWEIITLCGGCILSLLLMGFLYSSPVLGENSGLVRYNEVVHSLTLIQ